MLTRKFKQGFGDPGYSFQPPRHSTMHKSVPVGRRILRGLMGNYQGPVAIRMWNGETVIGKRGAPCTLVIRHPGVLRDLIMRQDMVRLAEAYLEGAVDIEGNLEVLFSLELFLRDEKWSWRKKCAVLRQAWQLPVDRSRDASSEVRAGRKAQHNSRSSIAHHYDVGNAFYRLWLDPEMVYSCAYFRDADQSLAAAQRDKLDYICRKLRLAPGQSLLDIGCGWGALILWAARHYGVQAHGITLSEHQYHHARERIRAAGLEDQVTVELRDYRDLPKDNRYDRVASVGMFEHIGVANYPVYFGIIKAVLKPGGLFLNHGITNDTGWQRTPITRFINKYVFPDGELARISDVTNGMEQAGFEVLDVESLRRHYALTLRRWIQMLESKQEQAVRASTDITCRLWRLYMAGSAYYFDEGSLNVYQALAGHARQALAVPLRREDLYA